MDKESQHTVSRFYLAGFTPQLGQKVLQQYNRRTLEVRWESPSTATALSHFYSVQAPDGTWDDSIEDWLQKIESKAAPALKLLATGAEPEPQTRFIVAFFIGAMFYRTTRMRENADLHAQKFLRPDIAIKFVESKRDSLLKGYSEKEVDDFKTQIIERNYGIPLAPNYYLIDFPERVDRAARLISAMAWTVESAPRGHFYVTSDNPAFTRDPLNLRSERIHALLEKKSELGFALSRDAFLICRSEGNLFDKTNASPTRVHHLNERTVLSSHEFVFSPERSEAVAALVAEHSGFRLRHPQLDLGGA